MGNLLVKFFSLRQLFEDKEWYTSKTVWFNILVFVLALVQYRWPLIQVDDETLTMLAGAVVAVVNVGLRLITKVPLTK